MIRYGLVGLGDNDFDGVIDGTGLPVASAANINVGGQNLQAEMQRRQMEQSGGQFGAKLQADLGL